MIRRNKTKVVVFDYEGAWVLTNPKKEDYEDYPHLINPDFTPVWGIPPEHWKLVNGKLTSDMKPKATDTLRYNEMIAAAENLIKERREHRKEMRRMYSMLIVQGLAIAAIVFLIYINSR